MPATWPVAEAGALLGWHVVSTEPTSASDGGAPPVSLVETVHLGAPLGVAAATMLGGALTRALGGPVSLRDVALAPDPITAPARGSFRMLLATAAALRDGLDTSLNACIGYPSDGGATLRALRASAEVQRANLQLERGNHWSFRWSVEAFADMSDAGADGGGP